MASLRTIAIVLAVLLSLPIARSAVAGSAHDFSFASIDGAPLPMAGYAGKAVLLVNTASECGFTPQYAGLQQLWQAYRDRGLVVLGVPSNDFGGQEPGSAAEIKKFCAVNFALDFPLTDKTTVSGEAAHPLYRWIAGRLDPDGRPRWNFHKFLITPAGEVVAGWPSAVEPMDPDLLAAVEAALPR